MHAVILAGGKGTRLRPYSMIFPKPLMPINNMPILEVVLRQLRANGFHKVTLAVGYLAELIQTFFGDGERLGLQIEYSREKKPLGTIAPLKLINNLPDTFLVMNGDILTNMKFNAFMDFHIKQDVLMTIATYSRNVNIDFGVLESDSEGFINRYFEKPTLDYNVSMGIYAFKSEVLRFIPDGKYFDIPNLVQNLLKTGEKVATFHFDGNWLDIGRSDDFASAIDEFEKKRREFLPDEK